MTNNNQKPININNVAFPLATIFSLLSFVMWATFEFAKDRQALKDELKREFSIELKAQRELIEQIKNVIIIVKERQKYQLDNLWSKKDHMLWCYETQKKNNNFNCPDYNSWKDHGLLGKYENYGVNTLDQKNEEDVNSIIQNWTRQNQLTEDLKVKKQ